MLFDMRGFWVDQRREGGRWRDESPLGRLLYRRWKGHEAALIGGSDHIVTLAETARGTVIAMPAYAGQPVSVIPCCADFEIFRPASPRDRDSAREKLGIAASAPVLGYVGSIGTVYQLDWHLRLFDAIRRRDPAARALFIGRDSPEAIAGIAGGLGLDLRPGRDLLCVAADRATVPYWIGACDAGSCLIRPGGSSAGVSPTKLGEYLACGLPVIVNAGVGDVAAQAAATGGHVMPDGSARSIEAAVDAFFAQLAADRAAIRRAARPLFDLPLAADAYDRLYRDLGTPVTVGQP